jgi:serine/threonine protein kinase
MSENAFPDGLPSGYRVHWYALERVLGQGGFGITYLARDTNLDQPVAIKEYLPVEVATRRSDASVRSRTEDHDERYHWGLERFIREARTLARFDHSNIVRVLSVFESNNTAYMVMRFEQGETLAELLERRHALPEAELIRVILPVLDGLELVHNAGFIHRDIKPDNILIRDDGTPVLLDFGSARYALGRSRTVTILVAPGYAPFEQYYSSGENQGPWSDIYSLGATCYRAIAGRAPLDAISRSKGILGSTKELLVPAVAVGSGRYSDGLLRAIDHALAFAEGERPQTIAAWRAELPAAAPGPAAPIPAPVAPMPRAAKHASAPTPERPRSAWARARAPVLWGGAGAAAVILALAAAPWLAASRAPDTLATSAREPGVADTAERLQKLEEKITTGQRLLQYEREKLQDQRAKYELEVQRAEEQRKRLESQASQQKGATAPEQRKAEERALIEQRKRIVEERKRLELDQLELKRREAELQARASAEPPARAEPPPKTVTPAPAAPPAPAPPSSSELLARAEAALGRGAYEEAVAILRTLADKDHPRAMVRLGELRREGKGVERNDEEALRLFRRAAERGDGEAPFRMGDMYAGGHGVAKNDFQAYVWYGVAMRAGVQAAKSPQERVGALLQPAERAQAEKLVDVVVRGVKQR